MVLAHDILLHYYIVYTFLQSFIKIFQRSCVNEQPKIIIIIIKTYSKVSYSKVK